MTRNTNAKIAGVTYLLYAVVGICGDLLMRHAFGVEGDGARLARFAEYATEVRIDVLIKLIEAFSAFVLAVTLYAITCAEDQDLAMLALVCRVAEGVLGTLNIQSYLGLVWLAQAGGGSNAPDLSTMDALRTFLLMPVPSVPLGTIFFAVGSMIFYYLLLRGRMVPVPIAWLGVLASGLLVLALPLQIAGYPTGQLTRYYQWLPALVAQTIVAIWLLTKGVAEPTTR